MKVLIVGLSTRAIAESAVRGGYRVVTLDYFGDRDQKELVENYSLMRDFHLGFSSEALLEASHQLCFDAVVYISNLENHPSVVEALAREHVLLGNTPQTLRKVRHGPTLRSFCREAGIPFPRTRFFGEALPEEGRWLRKPTKSGGGHGISLWDGRALDERHFLQEYIEGVCASAAFVADGRDCVLLGVSGQLVGREELGARGFTWCGNVLPLELAADELVAVVNAIQDIAGKLVRSFGLRGVNGLDFVLARREGRAIPYLLEVNPRYTASMELVEWAYGLNVFDLHLRAFQGKLPSFSLIESIRQPGFYAKGVVYARREVVIPETAGWEEQGRKDIPFPGESILARHPICTVLASGRSRDECWWRLLSKANAVEQDVEGRE